MRTGDFDDPKGAVRALLWMLGEKSGTDNVGRLIFICWLEVMYQQFLAADTQRRLKAIARLGDQMCRRMFIDAYVDASAEFAAKYGIPFRETLH